MNLYSLLDSVPFSFLQEGYAFGLNWLGKIVMWIVEGVGIVGLGIIVFTLVLKAITLPFDIYQRVKMRKQTLIMREMKPELEKLQKQYANDKTTYNQKMMELYKKNGYSALGACLPMILSLVILIVAFQAFRLYSDYANLNMYAQMAEVYNAEIYQNAADGDHYHLAAEGEEDAFAFSWSEDWTKTDSEKGLVYSAYMFSKEVPATDENGEVIKDENGEITYRTETTKRMRVVSTDENKFLYYHYSLETDEIREYEIDTEKLLAYLEKQPAIQTEKDGSPVLDKEGNPVPTDEATALSAITAAETQEEKDLLCRQYVVKIGARSVKKWYKDHNSGFLLIKNVWYPDVSYNHPIAAEYSSFIKQFNRTVTLSNGEKKPLSSAITEVQYQDLTSELAAEKKAPNGYFILIILSIGLMVGSQLITMKSQKESNQYQTVDGQGAKTQKVMLVIMPLIYAVFAFMYSAAFSIYMAMSSLLSILVTLLSNLIMGRAFRKKEEKEMEERYSRNLPWRKDEDGKKKKKKKK